MKNNERQLQTSWLIGSYCPSLYNLISRRVALGSVDTWNEARVWVQQRWVYLRNVVEDASFITRAMRRQLQRAQFGSRWRKGTRHSGGNGTFPNYRDPLKNAAQFGCRRGQTRGRAPPQSESAFSTTFDSPTFYSATQRDTMPDRELSISNYQ